MIINTDNLENNTILNYDVCIIGGGAAGITIANEFSDQNIQICLIDSGGKSYSRKIQKLYCGEISGDRYFPLHLSRLRYYGGSTNHWGGGCLPFDEFEFIQRDWIPYSGWPITFNELLPYYKRASNLLNLDDDNHSDLNSISISKQPGFNIFNKLLKYTNLDNEKFGTYFYPGFHNSKNIDLILNGNVTKIAANKDCKYIDKIEITTLSNTVFNVNAKTYILATGGIENSRLLLISNDVCSKGIGNERDLVGRYFMDHIFYNIGFLRGSDKKFEKSLISSLDYDYVNHGKRGLISPDYSYLRNNNISNCYCLLWERPRFKLSDYYTEKSTYSALHIKDEFMKLRFPIDFTSFLKSSFPAFDKLPRLLADSLKNLLIKDNSIVLRTSIEQVPNPSNRVILTDKKDSLGLNMVKLEWRITDQEYNTVDKFQKYLLSIFDKIKSIKSHFYETTIFKDRYEFGYHHSGTTRMSDNPATGVVDKNCKVFGISNLYVAGSSVFPTAGAANPTLTIIALAIRLAEHIKTAYS